MELVSTKVALSFLFYSLQFDNFSIEEDIEIIDRECCLDLIKLSQNKNKIVL
jgi:hypothetical protein